MVRVTSHGVNLLWLSPAHVVAPSGVGAIEHPRSGIIGRSFTTGGECVAGSPELKFRRHIRCGRIEAPVPHSSWPDRISGATLVVVGLKLRCHIRCGRTEAPALRFRCRHKGPATIDPLDRSGVEPGLSVRADCQAYNPVMRRRSQLPRSAWPIVLPIALGCALAVSAAATSPVRVLVVTGGHDYPTSFYSIFEQDGLAWDHAVSNEEAFRRDLRGRYDALVLYDMSASLSPSGMAHFRHSSRAAAGSSRCTTRSSAIPAGRGTGS